MENLMKNRLFYLILTGLVLLSGCGKKDELQESQKREQAAIEEKQRIEDNKYSEAKDTVLDGHPIEAAKGLYEAHNQQEALQNQIDEEQQYQRNLK